jgi:hypothetical protein
MVELVVGFLSHCVARLHSGLFSLVVEHPLCKRNIAGSIPATGILARFALRKTKKDRKVPRPWISHGTLRSSV